MQTTSPSGASLAEAFRDALQATGLQSSWAATDDGRRPDLIGVIEGVPVAIELRAAPQIGDVLGFAATDADGAYKVLVSQRLSAAVREALRAHDIGYFDARGHLRLVHGPLLVDTSVGVTDVRPPRPPLRVAGSVLDVALAVLDGDGGTGVRALAKQLDRAPATVSAALSRLREEHLIHADGAPVVPDLFAAVGQNWTAARVPLADLPRPGGGPVNARLRLGFDPADPVGWVLADAAAAAAWGAPIVSSSHAPPDFYVPDPRALGMARALLGEAPFGSHACTVAVAPSPYVCRHRIDRSAESGDIFPAPAMVVAALDLASDPGRGREILDRWTDVLDPKDARRVW